MRCDICGWDKGAGKQSLRMHVLRVHEPRGPRPPTTPCPQCGKVLTSKNMAAHQRRVHGSILPVQYRRPNHPVRVVPAPVVVPPPDPGRRTITVIKEFMTFEYDGRVWLAEVTDASR